SPQTTWIQRRLRQAYRQFSNPLPGCCKEGVRYSRSDRRDARFSAAGRAVVVRKNVTLGVRRIEHTCDRIVVEIALLDCAVLHRNLSVQSRRKTIDDPAFHLGLHAVGIYRASAVHDASYTVHLKVSV